MKFQDSSFNGLKVTVGTKSVTHARTHPPTHARTKSNMPHQLFQSWGHNKNIKMRSLKSSENIQKKEGGPDRSVSDNQLSSVTLIELAMKARKNTVILSFSMEVIH